MALLPSGFSAAGGAYQISRSLRFNSADSAYLNRTPASSSNRKTWTWSGWVKRTNPGTLETFFSGGTVSGDTTHTNMAFSATDFLAISSDLTSWRVTTQVFRDPSAWYHIVYAVDTTQATANNRIRIYVNGSEITAFQTTNNPSQNADLGINSATAHNIGRRSFNSDRYMNGYLTEINFIDGQALTPSSFGQTNASTGVWEPIAYTGTYGTNGFFLKFADNSGTTSTTLGKDSSGNGNDWTPNNFSVTAGAGNDSLVDTPTPYGTDTGAGGEVRGNYATLNPLDVSATQLTLSDGNLIATQPSTGTSRTASSTFRVTTGKWYFEGTTTVTSGSSGNIGIANDANASTTYGVYRRSGATAGLSGNPTFATYTNGDVIGVAFDADARTVSFYKNGTLQGTGNYTWTGTDSVGSRVSIDSLDSIGAWQMNFGQRPFAYTAPSGFKALCTQNLPTPTIGATSTTQANDYFDVSLYTGTGSSLNITGLQFQPDFVWIKGRSGATDHGLYDVVRGVQKQLETNNNGAETTETTGLTAFNSDGFTVGALAQLNTNTATYVGWNWKAGGTASTNTAGSITSTVSANTTAGFSVGTFTSQSSGSGTFGHGLGVAPSLVICKIYTIADSYYTYHVSSSANGYLFLNTTAVYTSSSAPWNNTAPTSSVVTLGTGFAGSYSTWFLAFAAVAGYSAFGSYTGNGSTDGPFVYCGFRPKFVITKSSDATAGIGDWTIHDTSRLPYNTNDLRLFANASNAESSSEAMDMLSNGFKIRATNSNCNTSGGGYIYAAFAESPFKYSLAR